MRRAKLIAAATILALAVIVFLQNNDPIVFHFLFFSPMQIPKTFLIFGSALVGSLLTLLIQFQRSRRRA